jgi:hypothetical protein
VFFGTVQGFENAHQREFTIWNCIRLALVCSCSPKETDFGDQSHA